MAEKTSSIKESSRTSSAPAASVSKRLSTSSPSAPSSGAVAPLLAPLLPPGAAAGEVTVVGCSAAGPRGAAA